MKKQSEVFLVMAMVALSAMGGQAVVLPGAGKGGDDWVRPEGCFVSSTYSNVGPNSGGGGSSLNNGNHMIEDPFTAISQHLMSATTSAPLDAYGAVHGAGGGIWHDAGSQANNEFGIANGYARFDLGEEMDITYIHIWNNNRNIDRGITLFDLYVSNDLNAYNVNNTAATHLTGWILVSANNALPPGVASTSIWAVDYVVDQSARYVMIRFKANNGSDYTGLDEVRFTVATDDPPPIEPPADWVLPSMAMLNIEDNNVLLSATNLAEIAPTMLQVTDNLSTGSWIDVPPSVTGATETNWTHATSSPRKFFRINPFWSMNDSQPDGEFVQGGQFKDLILPVPIVNGLESEGIWGNDSVVPRDADNGVEDSIWSYWGGNPILGNDGNYHIAVCRWLESEGHSGWYESEVAHCVSDNPIGPYVITGTIVARGHNPEVMKMPDGSFALHIIDRSVYTANNMAGPWTRLGGMGFYSRGFLPNDPNRMGANLTTELRPDGSVLLMKKDGFTAISQTGVLGPYLQVSRDNYTRNSGYAEDPVIWRSRHQYHCIYNHAQDRKSGYMRSLDGIHWKNEEGVPYDASSTIYEDGTTNQWYKFERAKVLQDETGRATHLSLALMDVAKSADQGNDNHSSKNMIMPLTVEKQISIGGSDPITSNIQDIAVLIEAEDGFDPLQDLDLGSLRFGSDSLVNRGGGCKVAQVQADEQNLWILFSGDHGLTRFDYDFKLLGQTKQGDLVLGYALLPGKSALAATLISLPVQVNDSGATKVVESTIENWGFERSEPVSVAIFEHSVSNRLRLATLSVPALEPYATSPISLELDNPDADDCEYEIQILGQETCQGYWRMVDETDPSVEFVGSWTRHATPNAFYYMNNEHITETIGDSVTFTFAGRKAAAYGYLGNEMGSFQIYIDGEFVESVRLSFGGHLGRLYQTPLLPEGEHVLELRCFSYSGSSKVAIDAFAFESLSNKEDN